MRPAESRSERLASGSNRPLSGEKIRPADVCSGSRSVRRVKVATRPRPDTGRGPVWRKPVDEFGAAAARARLRTGPRALPELRRPAAQGGGSAEPPRKDEWRRLSHHAGGEVVPPQPRPCHGTASSHCPLKRQYCPTAARTGSSAKRTRSCGGRLFWMT